MHYIWMYRSFTEHWKICEVWFLSRKLCCLYPYAKYLSVSADCLTCCWFCQMLKIKPITMIFAFTSKVSQDLHWPDRTGWNMAELVSAPALGPSVCCLPCLSLSSASAVMRRVWQTQGVAALVAELRLRKLWGHARTQLGAARRQLPGAKKYIKYIQAKPRTEEE